jgi:hypothetical protein
MCLQICIASVATMQKHPNQPASQFNIVQSIAVGRSAVRKAALDGEGPLPLGRVRRQCQRLLPLRLRRTRTAKRSHLQPVRALLQPSQPAETRPF